MGREMRAALVFLYELIFPFHIAHGGRLREADEPHRRATLHARQCNFSPGSFERLCKKLSSCSRMGRAAL